MATQKGRIHLSLVDNVGVRAATEFFMDLDDTKTVAEFIADVNAFGALVLPLVRGGWIRWEAGIDMALPSGASASPLSDAEAAKTGEWSFNCNGSPWLYTVALPTLYDAILVGSKIDSTDTHVAAFEAGIIPAFANGTQITNRNDQTLASVARTFLGDRKHRRSLHGKSLDVR